MVILAQLVCQRNPHSLQVIAAFLTELLSHAAQDILSLVCVVRGIGNSTGSQTENL